MDTRQTLLTVGIVCASVLVIGIGTSFILNLRSNKQEKLDESGRRFDASK